MSESLLSTGNALWFGPICYGGEKNTSNEKEHQESLLAQQNGKHFQQNIHSSYFLWQESDDTTQIQRADEGNLQWTMPEQCLITMNFLYVKKKMAYDRVHNIGIHVIAVTITSAI